MMYGSDRFSERNGGGSARFFGGAVALAVVFLIGLAIGFEKGQAAPGSFRLWTGANASSTGRVLGIGGNPPPGHAQNVDFSLFWKTWDDLHSNFYHQPVDDKALFYGALRGMTDALDDPYTNFFEPRDAETFNNDLKGTFSGIGAEIGAKNGRLQVIAPLPDSPAERAGVRARDLILKIDGTEALTMPVDEAVTRIRGEKGTKVTLQLGRAKDGSATTTADNLQTIDVTIVRDTITVKSVDVKAKDHGVFVINIHSFNEDTGELFQKAVDQAVDKGAKGIVLDLRNDPGGYLDRAVQIAGEWLPDDIVVQQRQQGKITERYKGTGRGKLKGIKTVVLVNEGSASASEIVAGALQDKGAATIVGKTSFGKGSVQDYIENGDGSALKVTIAEWLTPNGRSINHEGITPDVVVDLTPEDINAERDPQLEKAIDLLRSGQAKPE
jgi:carboxyl-terminal processing protease